MDRFIAVSYGAQQKFAVSIEKLIEECGKAEQARLAQKMPNREITLCEDETFHPQVCRVVPVLSPLGGRLRLD